MMLEIGIWLILILVAILVAYGSVSLGISYEAKRKLIMIFGSVFAFAIGFYLDFSGHLKWIFLKETSSDLAWDLGIIFDWLLAIVLFILLAYFGKKWLSHQDMPEVGYIVLSFIVGKFAGMLYAHAGDEIIELSMEVIPCLI